MIKMLVLADDLTGALDTGVQFSAKGVDTVVLHEYREEAFAAAAEVLVINTETRNVSPHSAYAQIREIATQAQKRGIKKLYKKTDSGLRGNVGAELQAVLDVYGGLLAFAPAHPSMNRMVIDGRLYVDGELVSRSVFGRDPFKPVREDNVEKLVAAQATAKIIRADGEMPDFKPAIWLFDGSSMEEMEHTAQVSMDAGVALFAGCAGFAEVLIPNLNFSRAVANASSVYAPLFVVSGSVSDVSFRQLNHAIHSGWKHARIEASLLVSPDITKAVEGKRFLEDLGEKLGAGEKLIVAAALDADEAKGVARAGEELELDTDELKRRIATNLGKVCAWLLEKFPRATPAVIGGDTLSQALKALSAGLIRPMAEVERGTVLSLVQTPFGDKNLISKSGSFGGMEAIDAMQAYVLTRHTKREGIAD